MSEMGEAADWVALHAALAWVATRDSQIFQRAIEHPTENLYVDVPWEVDQESAIPLKEQGAWLELKSAIMAGTVRARAFPYQEKIAAPTATSGSVVKPSDKRPPLRFSARALEELNLALDNLDEQEEEEQEPTPVAQRIPLPLSDINNLVLGGADKLRPAEWALLGGRGWRSVEISRVDLARAFPVDAISGDGDDEGNEREGESQEMAPSIPSKKLDWKSCLVREIIKEEWPQGIPPNVDKVAEIQTRLRRKLLAKAEQENLGPAAIAHAGLVTVGYPTITKAERDIRLGK